MTILHDGSEYLDCPECRDRDEYDDWNAAWAGSTRTSTGNAEADYVLRRLSSARTSA